MNETEQKQELKRVQDEGLEYTIAKEAIQINSGEPGDLGKLFEALSKVHGEIRDPGKNKDGQAGSQKIKYSSLPQYLEQLRPLWARYGIACTMLPYSGGTCVYVTVLAGKGSAWIKTTMGLPKPKMPKDRNGNDNYDTFVKTVGKILTYLERYILKCMFAVEGHGEQDPDSYSLDDGMQDEDSTPKPAKKKSSKKKAPPRVEEQEPPAMEAQVVNEPPLHAMEIPPDMEAPPAEEPPASPREVLNGIKEQFKRLGFTKKPDQLKAMKILGFSVEEITGDASKAQSVLFVLRSYADGADAKAKLSARAAEQDQG